MDMRCDKNGLDTPFYRQWHMLEVLKGRGCRTMLLILLCSQQTLYELGSGIILTHNNPGSSFQYSIHGTIEAFLLFK